MHTTYCTQHTAFHSLYTTQCSINSNYKLHTEHFTLHTAHCSLNTEYTKQFTEHTEHTEHLYKWQYPGEDHRVNPDLEEKIYNFYKLTIGIL